MKLKSLFFSSLALLTVFNACNDEPEDPIIANESELITTVIYELISESKADTLLLTFRDLDGDGGMAPEISSDTLKVNTNYHGLIKLLDESGDDTEDITVEVSAEGEEHQLFYLVKPDSIAITYNSANVDGNGNPVGISTQLSTGGAFQGSLTITLRHEPDKFADGVADGKIDNAGGETDIEIEFPISVE